MLGSAPSSELQALLSPYNSAACGRKSPLLRSSEVKNSELWLQMASTSAVCGELGLPSLERGAAPPSCVFGYVPVVAFAFEALPPLHPSLRSLRSPLRPHPSKPSKPSSSPSKPLKPSSSPFEAFRSLPPFIVRLNHHFDTVLTTHWRTTCH